MQDRLREVLAALAVKVEQAKQSGTRITEQETKDVLILPVLAALGWDTQGWHEVRREFRHKPQDNPVDYALCLSGVPCCFVEAKALGIGLNDRKSIAQAVNYANTAGVEWCALTNGDEYRIYNTHAAVDVEDKLLLKVRIADSDAATSIEPLSRDRWNEGRLAKLWQRRFVDSQVEPALLELLNAEHLVGLLSKNLPDLSSTDISESLRRARISVAYPDPNGMSVEPVSEVPTIAAEGNGGPQYWFFNTNETYSKGAHTRILEQGVIAVYGKGNGENILNAPYAGDRVLVYVNGSGIVAIGRIGNDKAFSSGTVFGKQEQKEFQRRVEWETRVSYDHAVTLSEVRDWGSSLPIRSTLCRLRIPGTVQWVVGELKKRQSNGVHCM